MTPPHLPPRLVRNTYLGPSVWVHIWRLQVEPALWARYSCSCQTYPVSVEEAKKSQGWREELGFTCPVAGGGDSASLISFLENRISSSPIEQGWSFYEGLFHMSFVPFQVELHLCGQWLPSSLSLLRPGAVCLVHSIWCGAGSAFWNRQVDQPLHLCFFQTPPPSLKRCSSFKTLGRGGSLVA